MTLVPDSPPRCPEMSAEGKPTDILSAIYQHELWPFSFTSCSEERRVSLAAATGPRGKLCFAACLERGRRMLCSGRPWRGYSLLPPQPRFLRGTGSRRGFRSGQPATGGGSRRPVGLVQTNPTALRAGTSGETCNVPVRPESGLRMPSRMPPELRKSERGILPTWRFFAASTCRPDSMLNFHSEGRISDRLTLVSGEPSPGGSLAVCRCSCCWEWFSYWRC